MLPLRTPTVVYSNTEKPYAEWEPAYVILSFYEKGVPRFKWVPWKLYQFARPEAERLIVAFFKEGRWGKRTFNVARWKKHIIEAIVDIINDDGNGLRCRVEYPPFEENHCRVFHLERG